MGEQLWEMFTSAMRMEKNAIPVILTMAKSVVGARRAGLTADLLGLSRTTGPRIYSE